MPISKDFTSILELDWEINFLQCFPNGYLKYTDLCNLFQLTAAKHSELGGISFSDMQQFDQAWVLSKMRIEIVRLPKWKEVVTLKTWINSLENSRSTRCIEMYIGNEKIAGCETFWVVFNTKTRKPEPLALPDAHFEKFPNDKATNTSFKRIVLPEKLEKITSRVVLLSDLDIVNHVNNVKYLEWCIDFVEANLILNQKIESFEMNFLKELSINDPVIIYNFLEENSMIFTITKEDKISFALQLNYKT